MDFNFADISVVDNHVHFSHLDQRENILKIMRTVPMTKVNLLSTPDRDVINHNPALIGFKAHHPERTYISGALDYQQVFGDHPQVKIENLDPARISEILTAQVHTLDAMGFEDLKLLEGKPTMRS